MANAAIDARPESLREPMTPAIYPYMYELLWNLAVSGPLTASEMAEDHNRPTRVQGYEKWDSRDVANRLRSAEKRGLVLRDHDGFWMLTHAGRYWMAVA